MAAADGAHPSVVPAGDHATGARRLAIGLACAGWPRPGSPPAVPQARPPARSTLNFYFYPDTSAATADGHQQLQQRRATASTRSPTSMLPRPPTASASSSSGGWPRMTTRSTSWASTSPGRPSSPRRAGSRRGPARTRRRPRTARSSRPWKRRSGRASSYAVPDNSNTQLLWYRSALVPNPPKTWAQMFADAAQLKKEGKPHLIEIQGAQYEGVDRLVQHAGGQRGRHHPEPGRDQGDARPARRQGPVDHEAARHRPRRRPVAGRADGEPEPAGDGGRARPPSS